MLFIPVSFEKLHQLIFSWYFLQKKSGNALLVGKFEYDYVVSEVDIQLSSNNETSQSL